MFAVRDSPKIIKYVNENRNFFAKWAYAAAHVDHTKFLFFVFETILSYKAQRDDMDDLPEFKTKDIEPMTYAKLLYEYGD